MVQDGPSIPSGRHWGWNLGLAPALQTTALSTEAKVAHCDSTNLHGSTWINYDKLPWKCVPNYLEGAHWIIGYYTSARCVERYGCLDFEEQLITLYWPTRSAFHRFRWTQVQLLQNPELWVNSRREQWPKNQTWRQVKAPNGWKVGATQICGICGSHWITLDHIGSHWITSAGSDRWNMVERMDLTAGIVSGFAQSELAAMAHQCFYIFDSDESVSHAVFSSIQAMSDFLSFR